MCNVDFGRWTFTTFIFALFGSIGLCVGLSAARNVWWPNLVVPSFLQALALAFGARILVGLLVVLTFEPGQEPAKKVNQ